MKKANPNSLLPFEENQTEEDTQELAQIVPIRTETTLTRYPFHRIAKRGDVKIKETKKNERGKVITTWEVRHPPGPLAYKLDTLVINRRIDEMRQRGEVRQLFKLGSLRDLCEELGIAPNGTNINGIKEALRENAFAGITCKLEFTGNDGAKRDFEFNTTRYAVTFTGEKLPSGKRADAVYIKLHDDYQRMLQHSKTRPLNYEYLRELAPAPQRLYELLSFAMFGTLTHARPNAQMLYSEFCQSAPLTRHTEYFRVRSQMRKIHKPHLDAGYIKSVEFEETTDETGAIDWLMKYTPGRRARNEYRVFTKKQEKLGRQKEAAQPRLLTLPKNEITPVEKDDSDLVKQLRSELGISLDRARAIEENEEHRTSARQWLDAKTYVHDWKTKGAGFWIEAITKPYELPSPLLSAKSKAREVHHAVKKQKIKEARSQHEEKFRDDYWLNYLKSETERLSEIDVNAFEKLQRKLSMWDDFKDRPDLESMQRVTIEDFIEEHPELNILTFWEWDTEKNPKPFAV